MNTFGQDINNIQYVINRYCYIGPLLLKAYAMVKCLHVERLLGTYRTLARVNSLAVYPGLSGSNNLTINSLEALLTNLSKSFVLHREV